MTAPLDRLKSALTGRYVIERHLGAGGMATVYVAQDVRHGRRVALKVLRPELALVLGPDRFLREIQIAAQLNHPHILAVHDSGDADGVLYYVMPLVEGESLRDRLRREKRLPVEAIVHFGRQVTDALAYAHDRGIIHRDIKPENILLSGNHAVVADFGIARAIGAAGNDDLTQTGMAIGTPDYMSPEQAAGHTSLDGRSDLYSVGCVLYELLTGEPPLKGPTPHATLARRLTERPKSVGEFRDDIPEAVERILTTALAENPEQRYATAQDMAAALQDPRVAVPPARRRKRARRLATVGALVAVATIAIGYAVGTQRAAGASSTTVAVFPFDIQGGESFRYLGPGMVNLLSTELDGAGGVHTVDARTLLGVLEREGTQALTPERGRALARRFAAGRYVLGSILEAGGRLRVTAELYDATAGAQPLTQASVEGEADHVFQLADSLARQFLGRLAGGRQARLTEVASVTTHSLPALKAYLDGEAAFRAGRWDSAATAFALAANIDSLFALAWYRLSVVNEWLTRTERARAAAERAVALGSRLGEHDRLLLQGLQAIRRGKAAEAERLYRSITHIYPDDLEGWMQLGEVLFHHGPMQGRSAAESRPVWERLLQFDPDNVDAMLHLARVAASEGRTVEVDSIAQRVIPLVRRVEIQDAAAARAEDVEAIALRAFMARDSSGQQEALVALRGSSDATLVITAWVVTLYSGNLPGGVAITRLLTDSSRAPYVRMVGHLNLAYLAAAHGRLLEADSALALAAQLDPRAAAEHRALLAAMPFLPASQPRLTRAVASLERSGRALPIPANASSFFSVQGILHGHVDPYFTGLVAAGRGDEAETGERARQLERMTGPDLLGLGQELAHGVRAELAWQRNRPAAVLRALEGTRREFWYQYQSGSPFYSGARERYRQAQALEALGQTDEALRWYRSFAENSVFDLIYVAPGELRQAEIEDRRGRREEALAHYRRFLGWWKNADPELQPMVKHAEERVAEVDG